MKILLFGKNGQLGQELFNQLKKNNQNKSIELINLDKNQANFLYPEIIEKIILQIKPNIIINSVAFTNVEECEIKKDLAYLINGKILKIIANTCKLINGILIHYSTNYIFDGKMDIFYKEEDKTNPLSIYGKSKLLGEELIKDSNCKYFILRTSWLYSDNKSNNFIFKIIKLAQENKILKITNEQFGTPTNVKLLSEITNLIIQKAYYEDNLSFGIYNCTNLGFISYFNYANFIIEKLKEKKIINLKIKELIPIKNLDLKGLNILAERPKNGVLDNNKLMNKFKIRLPLWQNEVNKTLEQILCKKQIEKGLF